MSNPLKAAMRIRSIYEFENGVRAIDFGNHTRLEEKERERIDND
jgi:hypothetical protein